MALAQIFAVARASAGFDVAFARACLTAAAAVALAALAALAVLIAHRLRPAFTR
jgi:hypothetical protein